MKIASICYSIPKAAALFTSATATFRIGGLVFKGYCMQKAFSLHTVSRRFKNLLDFPLLNFMDLFSRKRYDIDVE